MDEISQAQKNFVDYFIETGNQTEAYKKRIQRVRLIIQRRPVLVNC